VFPRHELSGFANSLSLRDQRAQGKPGADCARSLVCSKKSTRVSHHRFSRSLPLSPRNGFSGLLRALPGERPLLPPSPAGSPSAKCDPMAAPKASRSIAPTIAAATRSKCQSSNGVMTFGCPDIEPRFVCKACGKRGSDVRAFRAGQDGDS